MSFGEHVQYAGFWRRLAASLIDSLIFGLILGLMWLLLGWGAAPQTDLAPGPQVYDGSALLRGLAQNLLFALVTVIFWLKFLGTPGKLLLGCQVVDARSGGPLRTGQALLRYLAYFVSALPLGLGFLWIAFDKRKQGFHDKIAKTVVVLEDMSRAPLPEIEKDWK